MSEKTSNNINIAIVEAEGIVASTEKSPWKAPTLKSLNAHQAEGGKSFFATEPTTDSGPS